MNITRIILIAAATISLGCSPAVERGISAYESGDYKTALTLLQRSANQGKVGSEQDDGQLNS